MFYIRYFGYDFILYFLIFHLDIIYLTFVFKLGSLDFYRQRIAVVPLRSGALGWRILK
jgi:hypothetical protein